MSDRRRGHKKALWRPPTTLEPSSPQGSGQSALKAHRANEKQKRHDVKRADTDLLLPQLDPHRGLRLPLGRGLWTAKILQAVHLCPGVCVHTLPPCYCPTTSPPSMFCASDFWPQLVREVSGSSPYDCRTAISAQGGARGGRFGKRGEARRSR
jgi:hypothetical protein